MAPAAATTGEHGGEDSMCATSEMPDGSDEEREILLDIQEAVGSLDAGESYRVTYNPDFPDELVVRLIDGEREEREYKLLLRKF